VSRRDVLAAIVAGVLLGTPAALNATLAPALVFLIIASITLSACIDLIAHSAGIEA